MSIPVQRKSRLKPVTHQLNCPNVSLLAIDDRALGGGIPVGCHGTKCQFPHFQWSKLLFVMFVNLEWIFLVTKERAGKKLSYTLSKLNPELFININEKFSVK